MPILIAVVVASMLAIWAVELGFFAAVRRLRTRRVRTMTVPEQWVEIRSRLDARCPVVAWMEEDLGSQWAVELVDGLVHANPYEAVAAYERAFARRGIPQTWLSADRTHLVPRRVPRTVVTARSRCRELRGRTRFK